MLMLSSSVLNLSVIRNHKISPRPSMLLCLSKHLRTQFAGVFIIYILSLIFADLDCCECTVSWIIYLVNRMQNRTRVT